MRDLTSKELSEAPLIIQEIYTSMISKKPVKAGIYLKAVNDYPQYFPESKNINEELNRNISWHNARYKRCGRQYPKTILNIEGHIHHNSPIVCIDTKSCKKAAKKWR